MTRNLVIQLARLGDMIQSLPACRRLRQEGPVTLCLSFEPGKRLRAEVDEVLVVEPRTLARAVGHPAHFADRARSALGAGARQGLQRWDRVLCLNDDGVAIAIAELTLPGRWTGAGSPGSRYSDWIAALSRFRSENRIQLVELMQADLGGLPASPPRVNACGDGDIVLHMGSGSMARRLSDAFWGDLIVELCRHRPERRVLLTGSLSEAEATGRVLGEIPAGLPVVNLCGAFSLDELADVLEESALVIAQDTGVLHLAAWLRRPVVGLYHGSACLHETAPWLRGCHVLQAREPCSPCVEGRPTCEDLACRTRFLPSHVAHLCDRLLHDGQTGWPEPPAGCEHWVGTGDGYGLSMVPAVDMAGKDLERLRQAELLHGLTPLAGQPALDGLRRHALTRQWSYRRWREIRWRELPIDLCDTWRQHRDLVEFNHADAANV